MIAAANRPLRPPIHSVLKCLLIESVTSAGELPALSTHTSTVDCESIDECESRPGDEENAS
jgi:hypothetical protein